MTLHINEAELASRAHHADGRGSRQEISRKQATGEVVVTRAAVRITRRRFFFTTWPRRISPSASLPLKQYNLWSRQAAFSCSTL